MSLLAPEVARVLPPLRSQQHLGPEAIAHVRFCAPWLSWRWYASEFNPVLGVFYGVVVTIGLAHDYFTVDALETIHSRGGRRVEFDPAWIPRPLRECE